MAAPGDRKKRAVWHEVHCPVHGKRAADAHIPPSVRVSVRGIRKEKTAGCPIAGCQFKKHQ